MKDAKSLHTAVLLTGTNEGNLKENLLFAIQKISKLGSISNTSNLYESEAWGFQSHNFLNQAILIETNLSPIDLLDALQQIEKDAGRKAKTTLTYESRVLDIDIIFYDNLIVEDERLIIPHPHMQNRKFVLNPLNEMIPEYNHPVLKKSIKELLLECSDNGKVWGYEV